MTATAPAHTLPSTDEVAGGERAASDRIVVGVDGSDCSLTALRWALAEGDLRHLPVHVVLSWSMPPILGMAPVVLPSESELEAGARAELDAIVKEHAENVQGRSADSPITSAVAEGSAALALIAAAEQASLLVVGTRGHGGFAGLLLGSVSQQCVAHASCPVVVVH